jgi:hypothetical protein
MSTVSLKSSRICGPRWSNSRRFNQTLVLVPFYVRADAPFARNYDISPDGRRFLMIKQAGDPTSAPPQIIVVQNWHEERRVQVAAFQVFVSDRI